MKIQRVDKAATHKVERKENEFSESAAFTNILTKRKSQLSGDRHGNLLKQIEEQGKKLSQFQSVDSLRSYKKAIKSFVNEVVQNGLTLKEERGFNRRDGSSVHKLVEEVDRKLVELTNEILSKEKEGLKILSMVGEIQGLLINIYT